MTAKRIDSNQTAIVKAIRSFGASVQILSDVGKGCPDLLIGYQGMNFLFELKDGGKCPSKRRLTDAERHFHETWVGQVVIINSIEEALDFLLSRQIYKSSFP